MNTVIGQERGGKKMGMKKCGVSASGQALVNSNSNSVKRARRGAVLPFSSFLPFSLLP